MPVRKRKRPLIRQGAIGEGRLDLQVNVDLKKAIDLDGATLHANGYKIFGDGLKDHAGRRAVRLQGHETLLIREGRAWVELAGARDAAGPDEPAAWVFWTVPQVEALRRERHPEQFA